MATRVIRCSKCGLCYPSDYFEKWGRSYGIGLGPKPVCEGLDNNFALPIPKDVTREEQIMHPVGVCAGDVELVDVTDTELNANKPILAINDPKYVLRAPLMRGIQLKKSPAMAAMRASLLKVTKGVELIY